MNRGRRSFFILLGLFFASAVGLCMAKKYSKKYDFAKITKHVSVMPLVVVGSGPAGLNAAVYGARLGIETLVIRGDKPGGLIAETSWVENWPGSTKILGQDIVDNLTKQASLHGARFLDDAVASVDFSTWPFTIQTQEGHTLQALSVIIATGSVPRTLGVPGEATYWGAGVSSCAVCDAPLHQDKDVVVIGGGDSAIEEAVQLAQYAKNVTILVRRSAMRASAAMQNQLKEYPTVSVQYNVQVKEVLGDLNDCVTGIKLYDGLKKTTSVMPVDGVFLAIGHTPNTIMFKDYIALDKESKHIVLPKRTKETSVEGIFAAGDVEDNRYRQACVAAGSGAQAALDAQSFLASIGFTRHVASSMQIFKTGTVSA